MATTIKTLLTITLFTTLLSGCSSVLDVASTERITSKPALTLNGTYDHNAPELGEAEALAVKFNLMPNELVNDPVFYQMRYAINTQQHLAFKQAQQEAANKPILDFMTVLDLAYITNGEIPFRLPRSKIVDNTYVEYNGVQFHENISPITGLHFFIQPTTACDVECTNELFIQTLGKTFEHYLNEYHFDNVNTIVTENLTYNNFFRLTFLHNNTQWRIKTATQGSGNIEVIDNVEYVSSYPRYQHGKKLHFAKLINPFYQSKQDFTWLSAELMKAFQAQLKPRDVVYMPILTFQDKTCIGGVFVTATGTFPLEASGCDNNDLMVHYDMLVHEDTDTDTARTQ